VENAQKTDYVDGERRMAGDENTGMDSTVLGEIQVILAEKRTALAGLRTGIAVFALPLSVLSALIATSKYYDVVRVLHFLLPLLVLNLGLIVLGCYLVIHSISRIRHYDHLIKQLKKEHSAIAQFIE
jgi:uncharacterized membrane protein YkgB